MLFCISGTVCTNSNLLGWIKKGGVGLLPTNAPWLISSAQRLAADQGRHRPSSFPCSELSGMSDGKMGATLRKGAQSLKKSPSCKEGSSQSHFFFPPACTQAWGTKYVSLAFTLKGKKSLILWSTHAN